MQTFSMLPTILLACSAATAIILLTRLPSFQVDSLNLSNLWQRALSAGAFDRALRQLGNSGPISRSLRWLISMSSALKDKTRAPSGSDSSHKAQNEASELDWLWLRARRALVKASWSLLRRHLRTARLSRLNRALSITTPRLSSQVTTAIFSVSLP